MRGGHNSAADRHNDNSNVTTIIEDNMRGAFADQTGSKKKKRALWGGRLG